MMKHNYIQNGLVGTRGLRLFACTLMLTLAFVATQRAAAQSIASYVFTQGTTLYTPVSGTTIWSGANFYDDPVSGTVFMPFAFTYHGTSYTSLTVAGNGEVYLGYSGYCCNYGGPFYYNTFGVGNVNTLAAFGYDLLGNTGTAKVEYATVGSSPNREFVVQWTDWGFYSSGFNEIDFQIRLREADGSIQFVYNGANPQSGGYPQIGLTGSTTGDYNILTGTWGAANNTGDEYAYFNFFSGSAPANGTTFTWTQPSPCTGTPATPTISGPANACASQSFTLTATGYDVSGGLAFSWQSAPSAGGPWTGTGQTNNNTATVTQTAQTWYRLVTTCISSGLTSTSNVISVGMNGFLNCYCASSAYYPGYYSYIGQVKLGTCPTAFKYPAANPTVFQNTFTYENGYTDNTAVTPAQLVKGATYPFSATQLDYYSYNPYASMSVFIDFDQSGTFDAAEEVFTQFYTSSASLDNYSGLITVPTGAATGTTRMRVVLNAFGYDPEPCNNWGTFGPNGPDYYYYGETEDYYVNIVAGAACSGAPASPGTATASVSVACPQTNITLNVSVPPCPASGQTIQWEVSTDGGGTWNDVVGANQASSTISGQSQSSQYRLNVTCTNSGLTTYSSVVTVNQDASTNCYCNSSMYTVGPIDGGGDYLNSINLNGFSNLTGPNAPAPDYWIYTPGSITSLDKGSSYTCLVNVTPNYGEYVRAWIDYNQDGAFQSASESLGDVYCPPGSTQSITFTVPLTANTGLTRIRFRCTYATPNQDPCAQYTYGETEDYQVNITSLADCSGTPAAGTATNSDPNPVCSGIPFTISVTGSSQGVVGQLALQWQSAPAATGPWTNIAGANNSTFSNTLYGTQTVYYRRKDSCIVSGLTATTNALLVNSGACYCVPANVAPGTTGGFYLAKVELEGGLINNTTTGSSSPYYTYYNSPSGLVQQGEYYWLTLKAGTSSATHYAGAWFDWNQDGDFNDANETIVNYVFPLAGNGGENHVLVQVPAGALLGTTRMRVRVQSNKFTIMDPCATNYTDGETEDYDVQVVPSSCITPSQAGFINSVTPTLTTNGDAISFGTVGGVGTMIGLQYSTVSATGPWTPGLVPVYPGDPLYTQVNGVNFVYFRALYKNGGCPVDTSNTQFVKIRCHANIFAIGPNFDNDFISLVQIGTGGSLLNHASTYDATQDVYQNFTAVAPPHLDFATSYPVTINTGSATAGWPEYIKIWIDINGDDIYQASEQVFGGSTGQQTTFVGPGATYSTSGTITIPCSATATSGLVRMRVAANYGSWNSNDPCAQSDYSFGEIEGYTVFLNPVPNLTVTPPNAVCLGVNNALVVSGGTGTYTWSPTVGLSPTSGANVTATTGGTPVFYTVSGTLPNGCATNAVVPVASTPLGGIINPAYSTVCATTGSNILTVTGAAGNLQWQSAASPLGPWTDIAGATTTTYTTSGLTAGQTVYFRVMAKTVLCYDVASTTAVVTTSATPVVTFANVTNNSATVSWTPYGIGQYTVSWSGAGIGTQTNATSPFNITGLTSNANLVVSVTQTTPSCAGTSTGSATTTTLCGKPTVSSVTPYTGPAPGFVKGLTVNWTAVSGATAYRVYYRPLVMNANWSSVDVGAVTTATVQPLYAGVPYAVMVAANNCPATGQLGQPSDVNYSTYTAPGAPACGPLSTISAVSNCPNQLTATLSGGTGVWRVTARRLSPSFSAGVSYTVSSPVVNLSITATPTGSVWEVFAQTVCGSTYGEVSNVQVVTVKAPCAAPQNLVLSHPDCHGFTASWNAAVCGGLTLSTYQVYIKKSTAVNFVSYNGGTGDHKTFPYPALAPGSYYVFVRAITCNGSMSAASTTESVTVGGPGCKTDDETTATADAPTTVAVYPNPTQGQFAVDVTATDKAEALRIEVIDALGRVVYTDLSETEAHVPTLRTLTMPQAAASGIYTVRIQAGQNAWSERLVLQKD